MYGVDIPIDKYRDFLLKLDGMFDACVNLDPLDFKEAMRNMRILQKAGLNPMPVYHITDYQDRRYRNLIKSWCEEYEYVAVSGLSYKSVATQGMHKKEEANGRIESPYHDYIFNYSIPKHTKIHGLAATNQTLLKQYPFYSADSTTWKNSDRYGVVHEFVRGKLVHHAGERTRTGRTRNVGIKMQKHQRMIKSIDAWMKFEKYLTALWAERGITWP